MHVKQLAATLLVLCASSLVAQGSDRGLPVVHEEVDEICVIQTQNSDHCRVVFIRGESVLATRLMVDEMLWTTHVCTAKVKKLLPIVGYRKTYEPNSSRRGIT